MITVALPIYNSQKIAWIALESLCRQKVSVEWELLIAEEDVNAVGVEMVAEYVDRLKAAGCVSLKYFSLDYKRPLPQKWKYLAERRSKESTVFLLQAADDFSEPNRLQTSYNEVALNGFDWCQNKNGFFYNISTGQCMEYDATLFSYPTGLNMACAAHLLDRLQESWLDRGIDRWFYQSTSPNKVKWIDNSVAGGVYTDGLNNISISRKKNYSNPSAPFKETQLTVEDVLPADIIEKLYALSAAVS
jgi:hypothetical protein